MSPTPIQSMYDYRHIDDLVDPRWTTLDRLKDADLVREALEGGGLARPGLEAVAVELSRCADCAARLGRDSVPVLAGFTPGRVEVLGKHTDYAGGGSLVCAIQRGIAVVAVLRDDDRVTITDAASGETASMRLDPAEPPRPGEWANYGVVVCRRLSRDFQEVQRGMDITFSSNLPRASGMSSSSALTVALALALIQGNGLGSTDRFATLFDRPEDLAQYLGAVENGLPYLTLQGDTGVGTFGGSEDHTAILCSQVGLLKWYSYSPVRFHEAVAMPEQHVFALAFCGVHAEKTGAVLERYNYLSDSTAAVAASWRRAMDRDEPHLGAVSSIPGYSRTEVALAIREFPNDRYSVRQLTERLDHFHHENNLILPGAVDALERHDLERFGELVDRSQQLAETLLQNQTDETVHLAHRARELGAVAASAFGAGFGGAVWALVPGSTAGEFVATWSKDYGSRFPTAAAAAAFFLDSPGPAAFGVTP